MCPRVGYQRIRRIALHSRGCVEPLRRNRIYVPIMCVCVCIYIYRYIYVYIYKCIALSVHLVDCLRITLFSSFSSSSFTALVLNTPPGHLHSRLSAAHTSPSPTENVKILLHRSPFHDLRPFPSHRTNSRARGGSRWAAS